MDDFVNTEAFVKEINKLRLKGGWYYFIGLVNDKPVNIKGYNTWLQIFTVDGYRISSPMDISVKEFKNNLRKAV